ncbi:MAG: hypothetical protein R2856_10235 [Caldilineaceae bacterium]
MSLLNVLRDRLGDEWNTFAKTKLLSVPRPLLAVAIADDPEAALARMRGKVAVQLAQIEAGDSPRERRQNQPTLH